MANEIITTLHPDQDPDTNLYPNIKRDNIPNGSINGSKLDPILLSTIGSLHPSGVDTSSNILSKTSDDGIWVGSDTGKWYYWDGSQYVDGGVYQAVIINDGSVKYDSFDDNIKDHINNLDEKGKVIGRGWTDLTRYTNYQKIDKYRVVGYKTDGTYTPQLSANDNCDTIIFDLPHAVLKYKIGSNVFTNFGVIYKENEKAFLCNQSTNVEYFRQENGYVYIDFQRFIKDGYKSIALSFDRFVYDVINVFDDISDYISKSMKVTHSSFSFSDVLFDGSKIKTNRIDLSKLEDLNIRFGEYMNGYDVSVFIPTFRSLTTDNIGVLEFRIPDGYYWIKLPVSNNAIAHTQVAVLYKPNDRAINIQATETSPNQLFEVYNGFTYINVMNALDQGYTHISINIDLDSFYIDRCEKYIDKPQYLSMYLFGDFGVVGDSYTRGDAFTQDSVNVVNPNKSWGSTIAHRNGMDYTNYGYGGSNTRSYYTTEAYTRLMSDDTKPLYILDFGINDMVLGNDYIGSTSDINLSDPSLNANTFYGNYGKLISQILNRNSNTRIVLLSIATPLHTQLKIAFNTAIKNIATLFNIPFIDLYDDDYFYSRLYQEMQEGHPTYIGYNGMGLAIERLMIKCIEDNFTYFKFVGLD